MCRENQPFFGPKTSQTLIVLCVYQQLNGIFYDSIFSAQILLERIIGGLAMSAVKPYNSRLSASAPLSHNSQLNRFLSSAPKRQSVFCVCSQRLARTPGRGRSLRRGRKGFQRKTSQIFRIFRPFPLLLAAFWFYSCDPESSSGSAAKCSGGEPKGEARYTLTPAAPPFTLTIAECVTAITEGEFSTKEDVLSITGELLAKVPTRLKGKLGAESDRVVNNIVLPSTLTSIGDFAFYSHLKVWGKITIPKRVRRIGKYSFVYLGNESVLQPMKVEFAKLSQLVAIGESAFESAKSETLKLPESIETLGNRAFANLIGLKASSSFTIPAKVTKIGGYSFIPVSGTANITGTLTIASPYLTKANLGTNLFTYVNRRGGGFRASNFTIIKLHKAVYESYTEAERNAIFGTGATYQDLDGNAH